MISPAILRVSAYTALTIAFLLVESVGGKAASPPDPQMKMILSALGSLGGKPIETLSPREARKQPGPPDAVKVVLKRQGKSTAPEHVANVEDRSISTNGMTIPVQVYTPEGSGPFPVLVYMHGGGWVIASVQAYDSSCRTLANLAKCVVVSVGYRQAPEYRFPAAHEDAYAATQYVMAHTGSFGGDPKRVAVGGESAGGNLAAAVCLMARDRGGKMPIYQMLVYPIAGYDFNTPSYLENSKAKPLNRAMMMWFFRYYLKTPMDAKSPYISLVKVKNLRNLPPATVITDQIDPLRSEGKMFADHLRAAGDSVVYRNFKGVTHEFFGMGAVLDRAKEANSLAAQGLVSAFSK